LETEVLRELRQIKDITESYELYGDFDIMVKLESQEKERLQAIVQKLRGIKGIASTNTNYVFDPSSPYL